MYYLEDKHPSYEYTLYEQNRHGIPFIGIWKATDLLQVYAEIHDIEKKHGQYRQPFYIDNDFYVNEYRPEQAIFYYKFMKRKVNDWEILSERKKLLKKAN